MTMDERRTAFNMRLQGCSWAEIGRTLGYAYQTVHADIQKVVSVQRKTTCPVPFPALARYIMEAHSGNVKAFLRSIGRCTKRGYAMIQGKTPMLPSDLAAIREATGLSDREIKRRDA